jgi:hypothetical protein
MSPAVSLCRQQITFVGFMAVRTPRTSPPRVAMGNAFRLLRTVRTEKRLLSIQTLKPLPGKGIGQVLRVPGG